MRIVSLPDLGHDDVRPHARRRSRSSARKWRTVRSTHHALGLAVAGPVGLPDVAQRRQRRSARRSRVPSASASASGPSAAMRSGRHSARKPAAPQRAAARGASTRRGRPRGRAARARRRRARRSRDSRNWSVVNRNRTENQGRRRGIGDGAGLCSAPMSLLEKIEIRRPPVVPLRVIAQRHDTTKARRRNDLRWPSLAEVYEPYLDPHRESARSVLEIGVESGGSLAMWADYFPAAHIYGVDLRAPKRAGLDPERVTVIVGDQSDAAFREELAARVAPVDFVITTAATASTTSARRCWRCGRRCARAASTSSRTCTPPTARTSGAAAPARRAHSWSGRKACSMTSTRVSTGSRRRSPTSESVSFHYSAAILRKWDAAPAGRRAACQLGCAAVAKSVWGDSQGRVPVWGAASAVLDRPRWRSGPRPEDQRQTRCCAAWRSTDCRKAGTARWSSARATERSPERSRSTSAKAWASISPRPHRPPPRTSS